MSIFDRIRSIDKKYKKIRFLEFIVGCLNAILFTSALLWILNTGLFKSLVADRGYIVNQEIWGVSKFVFCIGVLAILYVSLVIMKVAFEDLLLIVQRSKYQRNRIDWIDLCAVVVIMVISIVLGFAYFLWEILMISQGDELALYFATDFEFASIVFDLLTMVIYAVLLYFIARKIYQVILLAALSSISFFSRIDIDFRNTSYLKEKTKQILLKEES